MEGHETHNVRLSEVTYVIGTRGCAYDGPNPDPKIWVHQNCISEFYCMILISYPKRVPSLAFKTKILSTHAQNVLYELRNYFKPN